MRRPADGRVVAVEAVAEHRRRSRLPVVEVEYIDPALLGAQRLQRGPREQAEAPRVVGVVPRVVAVEPVPVERRRVIDEPQPIAVGRDVDDRDRRRTGACAGIRHGDDLLDQDRVGPRVRHAPIARQEDVDRHLGGLVGHAADGARQRIDHVGQASGLGPRLAFG